jgi:hypothetical protein
MGGSLDETRYYMERLENPFHTILAGVFDELGHKDAEKECTGHADER